MGFVRDFGRGLGCRPAAVHYRADPVFFLNCTTTRHAPPMSDTHAQLALTPAEQNHWYLLATLHGVPGGQDKEDLQAKNRVTWNRYYASRWRADERECLKGKVPEAELQPFSKQELDEIKALFVKRAGGSDIPSVYAEVNFARCRFGDDLHFHGYVFSHINFSNATFLGAADFRTATFSGYADFSSSTFSKDTNFKSAKFLRNASFSSAIFSDHSYFCGATLSGHNFFGGAKFYKNANFTTTNFCDDANFNSVSFSENANFSGANFSGGAHFHFVNFSWYTFFSSASFSGSADFSRASFLGYVNFNGATCRSEVIFTNADLNCPTDFTSCRFRTFPPQFSGAKLHEGTVWRKVYWPSAPTNPDNVGVFIDAYERLKLEMDRLKKHEDELMFFAKELECRRVAMGLLRGLPIGVYGVLCDYGQSYLRPLGWLLTLILVGAVQFWPVLGWDFLLSLGVSTANTLGPLGLRKELIEAGMLPDLSRWLRFLSGAQMVLGLIFLFLIGLGLRNRFRMK